MESIKTYLFVIFLSLFFCVPGFSQNDYDNTVNDKKQELVDAKADSILVNTYYTEKDYNEKYNIKKKNRKMDEDEIYYSEGVCSNDKDTRKKNNPFLIEVAVDVAVEIVVGVIFVLSEIW